MKITQVKTWSENLKLTRPYTIAFHTFDSVENVFVYLETEDGSFGLGAGSPAEVITGESLEACTAALEDNLEELLLGKDIRALKEHTRNLEKVLSETPAARAAIDIALHDIFAKYLGVPLVDFLGRAYDSLPTSITIGIQSVEGSLSDAEEYIAQGFRILKLKIGRSVAEDVAMVRKLRERVGDHITIRVDANQGYTIADLLKFVRETESQALEFIEQPLKGENRGGMLEAQEEVRTGCVADESLHSPKDALALASHPHPFGIFNIKLMKCGGIQPAMQIAEIARLAGIDLMWGCMDESRISISAALHAALASPATRYLDLDGSFDLARDLARGGFVLKDGFLSVTGEPGLGVTPLSR
ncbi:MAG: mandelate racemase/muconate lactonizing enzyme family protein [bacterium]